MRVNHTERGFEILDTDLRVQQSSVVLEYEDALQRPGSSELWIGDYRFNREQTAELVRHLKAWLETGSLVFET